jgi:hypothetical protein
VAATSAIAGAAGYGVLSAMGSIAAVPALLVSGTVTVAAYGIAGRLFGLEDLALFWQRLRARSQRTSVSQP